MPIKKMQFSAVEDELGTLTDSLERATSGTGKTVLEPFGAHDLGKRGVGG